jgi:hypothetical protein
LSASPWVAETWAALRLLAEGSETEGRGKLDRVRADLGRLDRLLVDSVDAYLQKRIAGFQSIAEHAPAQILKLTRQSARLTAELDQSKAALEQREASIAALSEDQRIAQSTIAGFSHERDTLIQQRQAAEQQRDTNFKLLSRSLDFIAAIDKERGHFSQALSKLERELDQERAAVATEKQALVAEKQALEREAIDLRRQNTDLKTVTDYVLKSKSWRYTAPLRFLRKVLGRA